MIAVSSLLFSLPTLTLTCSSTPETLPLIHWLILPFPEALSHLRCHMLHQQLLMFSVTHIACYLSLFLPDRGPAQAVWTGLDVADGGGALELEGESAGCCGEWPQPLRCALRLCCQWWQHTEHHERYDRRNEWLRNMQCLVSLNTFNSLISTSVHRWQTTFHW